MQDVYSISGLGMMHRDAEPTNYADSVSGAFGLRREGIGAIVRGQGGAYGHASDYWIDLEQVGGAGGLGRMAPGDFWWQQKDFSRAPNWQLGAVTRRRSSFVMTPFGGTFFDHPHLGAMYFDSSRITRRIGAVFGPDQQGGPGGALLDPALATDNGDGTFTCVQDGSQVTDPSTCPQPNTLVNPFPNQTVSFPGGTTVSTDGGSTTTTSPQGTATVGPLGGGVSPAPAPPFPQFGASGGGAFGLSKNELLFVGAAAAGILGYAYFDKKGRRRRRG